MLSNEHGDIIRERMDYNTEIFRDLEMVKFVMVNNLSVMEGHLDERTQELIVLKQMLTDRQITCFIDLLQTLDITTTAKNLGISYQGVKKNIQLISKKYARIRLRGQDTEVQEGDDGEA